jgi:hypothetical protein
MTRFSRSWRLGLICIAAVCATLHCTTAEADLFAGAINDPVFGHYFYPGQATFKRMPFSSLGKACARYEHDWYTTSTRPPVFLYGRYEHDRTKIWIVGTDNGATLFLSRDGSCARTDPVIAFWQRLSSAKYKQSEPVMSRSEIISVFSDLLTRFAKAFGGKERFFRWLDEFTEGVDRRCSDFTRLTCEPTWHGLPSYLQVILNDFRSQSPK